MATLLIVILYELNSARFSFSALFLYICYTLFVFVVIKAEELNENRKREEFFLAVQRL